MSAAELTARRTAARAALADFRRDEDGADTLWLAIWAGRLAGLLGPVLDELDRLDTEERAGTGWRALERIDAIVRGEPK